MPSLRTQGLGVAYGGNRVFEDINISIDGPGLVGILGPNGVGKSTFMNAINKVITPSEGKVYLNGRDTSEMSYRDIARFVAYVPAQSKETFSMSVIDTVLMGRYPVSGISTTDNDVRIAAKCIGMMNVSDLAMRRFNELSAGQHQRVMIARGLAQEPEIMLLDEPTSNLDIYHQIYVMRLLRDLARERGIIVLAICHDLNVAAKFSDRLILFSEGKVVQDGPPSEVITSGNIREVYGVDADVVQVDGRPYAVYHADPQTPGGSMGTAPSD